MNMEFTLKTPCWAAGRYTPSFLLHLEEGADSLICPIRGDCAAWSKKIGMEKQMRHLIINMRYRKITKDEYWEERSAIYELYHTHMEAERDARDAQWTNILINQLAEEWGISVPTWSKEAGVEGEMQALIVELASGQITEDEYWTSRRVVARVAMGREEDGLVRFEHNGVKYLKDDEGYLYDLAPHEEVGYWDGSEVQELDDEEEVEEEDEEEVVVERFEHNGVLYLKEMGEFPQVLYNPKTHDKVGWKCGGGEIILK